MAIDWEITKKNIIKFFKNYKAKNEEDTAKFIVSEYETAILNGTEQYQNTPLIYNLSILENAFKQAFKVGKNGNIVNHFPQIISDGLIGFWTGATMEMIIPPPGATAVISNIVIYPGSPQMIIVKNINNFDDFATKLVKFFQNHLLTIKGINTGMVNVGSIPTPIPFAWMGIT